jgi:hypothetical protein
VPIHWNAGEAARVGLSVSGASGAVITSSKLANKNRAAEMPGGFALRRGELIIPQKPGRMRAK